MAGDADPSERSLEFAPTWALATVATIFVVISFAVERLLHWLGHFLTKTKRKALFAAFMKIKDELMLVGFISLAMALMATPISKICIKTKTYDKWTPCHINDRPKPVEHWGYSAWENPAAAHLIGEHGRRLLAEEVAEEEKAGVAGCPPGMEPFILANSLHQLHIFIFILAAVHVAYSCITMVLSFIKVRSWRKWEIQAQQSASGVNLEDILNSITFSRQNTFQKYHTSMCCSRNTFVVWVICFFQQIYIPRADYITLRQCFISNHHLRDDYDFHAYVIRSMEDDFQKIVGISAKLWAFVILFLLFNVHGVYLYFWSSFIPVLMVLVIGAKLQYVVSTLALEVADAPGAYVGHLLRPRDELFWFRRPDLVLSILHLVFFQNAFELATFFWHLWTFGFHSCLLERNKWMVYIRLSVGLAVQLFCSLSTLPLYKLVSQMGSNYQRAVLPPRVGRALNAWHKDARKRVKIGSLFSFGRKGNKSGHGEQQALSPKDPEGNSLSPPTSLIMDASTMERGVQDRPRTPRTPKTPKDSRDEDSHNVYVQIDSSPEKTHAERG